MRFISVIEAHLIEGRAFKKGKECSGFFWVKGVDTSRRNPIGHFVSLYGLCASHPIMEAQGVSFSMLTYYNECVIRLGVTVR